MDISLLGGKGYNLLRMKEAGLPVPSFVVIDSNRIDEILLPVRIEIGGLLKNYLSHSNPIVLDEIQRIILNLSFPSEVKVEINKELNKTFSSNDVLAIRSSAPEEDGKNHSFAGVHNSYLNVLRDSIYLKAKHCIASFFSLNAIRYRISHSLPIAEIKCAVVIQEMVQSSKSGVAFSVDVSGNLNNKIVVAAFGLGEEIVADRVETDRYLIARNTNNIEQYIQKNKIEHNETGEHDTFPVLNYKELLSISDLLDQTEKLLDSFSDIEFCIDSEGTLYIVQMRPITTVKEDEIKILDNTNIIESYPGINLPLTISFAKKNYQNVFYGALKGFGIPKNQLGSSQDIFNHLVDDYYGRMYYRLDNWYRVIAMVSSSRKSIESWESAVGLSSHKVILPPSLGFAGKFRGYVKLFLLILNHRRSNKQFYALFDKQFSSLKNYVDFKEDLGLMMQHFNNESASIASMWYRTLINDFIAFKSFSWLQKSLSKNEVTYQKGGSAALSHLIQSESQDAFSALLDLKQEIESSGEYQDLFALASSQVLSAIVKHAELNAKIEAYIARYGDRVLGELKLENESFKQNKQLFIDLLKAQLKGNFSKVSLDAKKELNHASALKELNYAFAWWNPAKIKMRLLYKLAAYGLKHRENMRFCRARIYGVTKEFYTLIGKHMASYGIVKDERDVFYLTTSEVEAYCLGKLDRTIQSSIEEMKAIYLEYAALQVPNRVIYTHKKPIFLAARNKSTLVNSTNLLKGTPVSPGLVIGEAVVITSPSYTENISDKILITKITDPGWVFLMTQAAGLVSEKGSLLSHTAIVGRELGIPVIVGVENLLQTIKSGDQICINGDTGVVEIIATSRSN